MKKIFYLFIFAIFTAYIAEAQITEQGIKYQAVVSNRDGEIITGKKMTIRIAIFEKDVKVYIEEHKVVSTQAGVINLVIGQGQDQDGDFNKICWEKGEVYAEIILIYGGDEMEMGRTKLAAVPTAIVSERSLFAERANHAGFASRSDEASFADRSNKAIRAESAVEADNVEWVDNGPYLNTKERDDIVVGDNIYAASAKLSVNSTNKGFLPPRMTTEQRDAIENPVEGLVIYQTDDVQGLYLYDGSEWSLSRAEFAENAANAEIAENVEWVSQGSYIETKQNNNVVVGGNDVSSAKLSVNATDKGFLPPRMTTAQRDAISLPAEGLHIYNTETKCVNFYNGENWFEIFGNCTPQPSQAYADEDQIFTNSATTIVTLNAEAPITGNGEWSVRSGAGYEFSDIHNPQSTFEGNECTAYELLWTVSSSCDFTADPVNITFNHQPSIADAGDPQLISDNSETVLDANEPLSGTGEWDIISGTGGNVLEPSIYNSTFQGAPNITYVLRWTISTNCDSNYDDVTITFFDSQSSNVSDYDGNIYQTVAIGNQIWMMENLKSTHYADGTAIPLVESRSAWDALDENDKAYCYFNNSAANGETYGALYTWEAAMNGAYSSHGNPSGVQGVCPDGWHLPSDAEWDELKTYLGGESEAGGKMKEIGTIHWNSPNTSATNESVFTALPGGRRNQVGTSMFLGDHSLFWSSRGSSMSAYYYFLSYCNSSLWSP